MPRPTAANDQRSLIIILYYYHPYVSGLSIYAKRLAEGLVKKGIKVTILTSRYDKHLPKKEIINGVEVIRRPVLFKFGKGVVMPTLPIDLIIFGKRYDYINPMLPMAEIGPALLFVPKKKIIVSYICDLFLGNGIFSRLITYLSFISMHIALIRAQDIFALSFDYLSHSKMKRYQSKASSVYPIIDADEFKPSKNINFFASTLHLKTRTKKIGFVGRIVYEKGIKYLLESIPYIDKKIDDFRIIIAGDYKNIAGGSIKHELDTYIDKYPNRIIFTGYLDDKALKDYYTNLDVLVLPSIDPLEAFGMVQVEAMLCGVPVIASDLPGVREVVNKTGYGLISKIKDPKDIAEKIIKIINNRTKYLPSRKRVKEIFNPDDSIDTYLRKMR